ncbi:23258_t:CDS:2 [Dentiscutata erythropus]|uniref:23258_t:CDS:1 n=1 Tax=Dentiscutata erythropus TaxID=1348616 RepID=A0A9N9FNG3_9GLOM|nr:23258_t:CDS:2 [Dentiscutata erythropus]
MSSSRLLKPETHRYYLIDDNENEANESDISNQQEVLINIPPPKDNYQIVYLIFFLQGVAMLLGWNVFITASVFFHSRFLGSPYSDNFQNYFSIVNMGSNLLFLTHALHTQTTANISARLIFSLFVSAFTFFAVTVSTQFLELFTPSGYFYFAITLVFLLGMTTAYQQNAIFGIVALFPPKYTQAVMSGQGLAGLAISLSQIFSALAVDQTSNRTPTGDDLTLSTFIYFLSAFAVIVFSLVSYFILIRLPLYIYHVSPDLIFVSQGVDNSLSERSYRNTFNKINKLIFAVAFVFCVTLSIYPSTTSFIKSVAPDDSKNKFQYDYLFIPLHFLIFNFGDFLGRYLPSQEELVITDQNKIAFMSICRVIFLPLILLCNVDSGFHGERSLPLLINSDLIYFLIIFLFAVSNGYVGSLAMMAGPQVMGVEKGLAGTFLSYFLVVGLTVGSIFSFPLRAITLI